MFFYPWLLQRLFLRSCYCLASLLTKLSFELEIVARFTSGLLSLLRLLPLLWRFCLLVLPPTCYFISASNVSSRKALDSLSLTTMLSPWFCKIYSIFGGASPDVVSHRSGSGLSLKLPFESSRPAYTLFKLGCVANGICICNLNCYSSMYFSVFES